MRTKRSRERNIDAILTSDWHLRDIQPACRTDDFWLAQDQKIKFLNKLQKTWDCPILIAGDIFHAWKACPFLLAWAIENLPERIIAIPGQHDLPNHNIDLIHKAALFVLKKAGIVELLLERETTTIDFPAISIHAFPFGSELAHIKPDGRCHIAIWHHMVWTGKLPYPGCKDDPATEVLNKYPEYSLILTGDNHESFVVKQDDRLLVNPGSLTRQAADQIDHKPKVYLWSAADNTVEAIELPIRKNVVSRDHIERTKERDERIAAFVKRLSDDWEVGLSFERNLEQFIKTNTVRRSVVDIIHKAMEDSE